MEYYLGLDAGTTNIKAVLFDGGGREVKASYAGTPVVCPGGSRAEADMDLLWEKAAGCIRDICSRVPGAARDIRAVGLTGQGEGLWLTDDTGRPVGRAILWCDGRAAQMTGAIDSGGENLGSFIRAVTGSPPLPGTQLMLMKWMAENEPEKLHRAAHSFFCKDWLRYRLTGEAATDPSDVGTSMYDLRMRVPAFSVMQKLGIGKYTQLIPPVRNSAEIAGKVTAESASQTGLREGTPVAAGSIDVAACAAGAGAVRENDICVVLGTTCAALTVRSARAVRPAESFSRRIPCADGKSVMDLRASMNGTYGLDWCRGNIAADPDPAEMDRAASASRAGSGGVIFEPYLSAAGERSPFCNSAAKGGFFGISALTRREDLIRAVYEGITFSIKDCLGKADSSAGIFLAGGGTRSKVWPQMIADVLGCRVTVPGGRELGAKGAMMMAAAATGGFPDIRAAAEKCCETAAEYLPGSDGAVYDRCYELFVGLRRAAGPLWERRAALMGPENAKQIV